MADTALQLLDRVFPEAPVRQWVLSVPRRIRYLLARDAGLLTGALRIFIAEVFRRLRRRGREATGLKSKFLLPGAVTGLQRFGSALNLNVHAHSMVLDGVHVRDPKTGELTFLPLPEPSQEELIEVLDRTRKRIEAFLQKRGCWMGGSEGGEEAEGGILERLQGTSILGWDGMAAEPRRTELWGRREDAPARRDVEKPYTANWEGWSLQAGVRIRAGDREGLGRLCRYILRPPLAGERLEELADGRVMYRFRKPMPDGSSHVVLEPLEFMAKLAALLPPPRSHLVHYHGSLAPHSGNRKGVVPAAPGPAAAVCECRPAEERGVERPGPQDPAAPLAPAASIEVGRVPEHPADAAMLPPPSPKPVARTEGTDAPEAPTVPVSGGAEDGEPGRSSTAATELAAPGRPPVVKTRRAGRPSRTDWATLLRKTLGLDALQCEACGGRMRVLAALTEPAEIRRFLASQGLPVEVPGPEPPRRPSQGEFDFVQDG